MTSSLKLQSLWRTLGMALRRAALAVIASGAVQSHPPRSGRFLRPFVPPHYSGKSDTKPIREINRNFARPHRIGVIKIALFFTLWRKSLIVIPDGERPNGQHYNCHRKDHFYQPKVKEWRMPWTGGASDTKKNISYKLSRNWKTDYIAH